MDVDLKGWYQRSLSTPRRGRWSVMPSLFRSRGRARLRCRRRRRCRRRAGRARAPPTTSLSTCGWSRARPPSSIRPMQIALRVTGTQEGGQTVASMTSTASSTASSDAGVRAAPAVGSRTRRPSPLSTSRPIRRCSPSCAFGWTVTCRSPSSGTGCHRPPTRPRRAELENTGPYMALRERGVKPVVARESIGHGCRLPASGDVSGCAGPSHCRRRPGWRSTLRARPGVRGPLLSCPDYIIDLMVDER